MAKRKPEQTCEVCRTLGDLRRKLEPEKHQCGPEPEMGEAIWAALEEHLERAGEEEGRSGE